MANIPASQAKAKFTQELIAVYRDKTPVTGFGRSFFPASATGTKYISTETQRSREYIASDVERGSGGNRNTFDKSTEKIFLAPYFREYFDFTASDVYDRLMGSTSISAGELSLLLKEGTEKMTECVNKIERNYERQAWQVLQTGIVTTSTVGNVDFERKADMMVDLGAGFYWTETTIDPTAQIAAGCEKLRTLGKAVTPIFNCILAEDALSALLTNDIFEARNDNRNFAALDTIAPPQRNAAGAAYHGRITCGSYLVDLWTYPQFYESSAGTFTSYITQGNMIILPQSPRFILSHPLVPQLIDGQKPAATIGAYVFTDYRDELNRVHRYDVESAGLCVPVAVDQIFTQRVVAAV